MWKAELCLESERVPVRLYAAARDRSVHFRLLHRDDLTPVQQQMVDPVSDRFIGREETQRGIEVDEGLFVILTDAERKELEPPPSRAIRVEQLVERTRVDPRWLQRPYYLGPDGDEEGYFALAQALEERDRIGIARWVMRKKRYHGALLSRHGYLLLQTMRHAEEMVALSRIRPPAERAPEPRERQLADQLVATLEGPFEPSAYRDEYRDRVAELLAAKAEGRDMELPAPEAPAGGRSLIEDLQASLSAGREAAGGR